MCDYAVYRQDGTVKEISVGMVARIHARWEHTMHSVADIRARMPQQRFGKTLSDILIRETVNGTSNGRLFATLQVNGRAASEPRIACRVHNRAGHKRSRSL